MMETRLRPGPTAGRVGPAAFRMCLIRQRFDAASRSGAGREPGGAWLAVSERPDGCK
jgi:hypothetical protein